MGKQEILDQTNEETNNKKRPIAIKLIRVIGFIGAAFTIPMIFSEIAGQIGIGIRPIWVYQQ